MNAEVRDLHRRAEAAVDAALLARSSGDTVGARAALLEALELERCAAELTPDDREPTHSTLCLGAAALALECGDREEASRLATAGLAGRPSPEVRGELERFARGEGFAGVEGASDSDPKADS